jgi:diguanylate cyclase (GGDEF)-like protein
MITAFTVDSGRGASYWKRLSALFSNEINVDEWGYLLRPQRHPPLLITKRVAIIINRVRLLALLFALLTPTWCVVDYLVFPRHIWLYVDLLRLSTALAFFALFLFYSSGCKLINAYGALFLLFLIPVVFYPVSMLLLSSQPQGDPIIDLVLSGYSFLPFVLMAGMAIFPLALSESLILMVLILFSQTLGIILGHQNQTFLGYVEVFWQLLLLGVISAVASASQLAFMTALVRQSIRDTVTRCFTRLSGEELLTLQFAIAQRSRTALSTAFIDLDHFKQVNDQFGHDMGDIVLQNAATVIRQSLRASDFLARWGGEEFLLVMPRTEIEQAKAVLERLHLTGLGKRPDGKLLTASIGIAELWSDGASSAGELVRIADQRMYIAKGAGRNQIICKVDSRDGGSNEASSVGAPSPVLAPA